MIKVWDIHGGIHPAENKSQSLQQPIQEAGIPPQLILPLSQHIGAPATPVVTVGDKVLKGQLIAEAKGFISAPVHASSSGVISAIEARSIPHPSGMNGMCIVIDTDGRDEWIEHQGNDDPGSLDNSSLLTIIRQAGIAGMGGAGFPAAVKLSSREDKPIESLLLNGAECEPYITADDILMRERAEEIIAGARILRQLINPSKETLIGVEDNKPEGIAALKAAAEGTGIKIAVFPTKYPSGGEKQLIQILTGKEVPSGGLPADVGVVCQNVGTATAIYRAVCHGEPLISRITTVTGNACQTAGNYQVLLGTPVQYLLDQSGFKQDQCIRLIMGGPMMGYTLQSTAVPVVKTSNCILAPTVEELPPPPPAQACIRCGLCAEACPVSLLPQQMYWFSRAQEHDKLEQHNLFDCIECGACSYVCPSNIPLVQYYRASKAEIRQAEQDKIKSERSKLRFEARQQRIEREAAEKEEKRRARMAAAKAKTSGGDSKIDVIQAAIERSKAKKAEQTQDPATAAIARAQAKRAGTVEDESFEDKAARLEKLLASAKKRLAGAQEKLRLAREQGDANSAAFETAVAKTTEKLTDLEQELKDHLASAASNTVPKEAVMDPAQAAIARAQAKRASGGLTEETDEEKVQRLQTQIASSEKRLAAAQEKLQAAQDNGDSSADALAAGAAKTQQKLTALQQELAALKPASQDDDPAQAAIARALAAREAAAGLSEEEKRAKNIQSLELRVKKTREKLATAQAEGAETTEILAESLQKLEAKLAQATQQTEPSSQ